KRSGIYNLHLLSVQSASSLAAHKLEGEILSKELDLQQTQTCNQELQIRLCCRIRWGFRSDYRGWIDGTTIAPTKSSTGIVFAVKRVKLYGFQELSGDCLFLCLNGVEADIVQCKPLIWTIRSAPALALNAQIEKTKRRFNNYGKYGLLCGADGIPHLMVNGDQRHWGEFITPGLLFLYIAGWIGLVGRRSYLIAISAQTEAINLLCGAKTQSNPENTVGILTMAVINFTVL
ncbi:hypothetical protein HID58_048699, partial [Brassica napus]